jgi:pilus assembly protein Flp/PilA
MMPFKRFIRDARGATAIEYALIAGMLSVAAVVGITNVGTTTGGNFDRVAAAFAPAGNTGGGWTSPTLSVFAQGKIDDYGPWTLVSNELNQYGRRGVYYTNASGMWRQDYMDTDNGNHDISIGKNGPNGYEYALNYRNGGQTIITDYAYSAQGGQSASTIINVAAGTSERVENTFTGVIDNSQGYPRYEISSTSRTSGDANGNINGDPATTYYNAGEQYYWR